MREAPTVQLAPAYGVPVSSLQALPTFPRSPRFAPCLAQPLAPHRAPARCPHPPTSGLRSAYPASVKSMGGVAPNESMGAITSGGGVRREGDDEGCVPCGALRLHHSVVKGGRRGGSAVPQPSGSKRAGGVTLRGTAPQRHPTPLSPHARGAQRQSPSARHAVCDSAVQAPHHQHHVLRVPCAARPRPRPRPRLAPPCTYCG